jgi:hypothetical protein
VLEALQTSAWPDCCGVELKGHVETCESCAGLVQVVLPLLDEHRAAAVEARVPTSASMWWRMRLRARREATKTAMRPIAVLQGLALACGTGLLLTAIGLASPAFRRAASWVVGLGASGAQTQPAASWVGVALLSPAGIAVALAVTLVFVVVPVAVYLTGRE